MDHYTKISVNKINWKKLNISLSKSEIKNSEVQLLSNMFNSIMESHTELADLIFIRQYLFSVLIRVHNYFKETNSLKSKDALQDIYDYMLTHMIIAIELSANYSLDTEISLFLTRVLSKIFDVDCINSAVIVVDSRYRLKQKYVIEPIISSNYEKISLDKAKEFSDFIFNMFSFCESSSNCVSISLLFSSMWIKDFTELPYFVDDSIMTGFSSLNENISTINRLLLTRRQYILSVFENEDYENTLDLSNYNISDFLSQEPDNLYDEIAKIEQDKENSKNNYVQYANIDENYDDIDDEDILNIINENIDNSLIDDALPYQCENEIKLYNNYVTDLNAIINGSLPKSNISDTEITGNVIETYPRLRLLFKSGLEKDSNIKTIIESLNKYEKEKYKHKRRIKKAEKINNISNILANKNIKDIKNNEDNNNNSDFLNTFSPDYFDSLFSDSKYITEEITFLDFKNYLNDILSTMAKLNNVNLNKDTVIKIINSYNSVKSNKINFNNVTEISPGKITFDRIKGKKILDKCIIENGKFITYNE